MVLTSSSLHSAQTQLSWTHLFQLQLPTWTAKSLPCFLVHIPERGRLIGPVCSFEPDYSESRASSGAAVIRMGWGHVEPNENTKKAGNHRGMSEWDSLHGQLAHSHLLPAPISWGALVKIDLAERLSSCHFLVIWMFLFLKIPTLRNFQRFVRKAEKVTSFAVS